MDTSAQMSAYSVDELTYQPKGSNLLMKRLFLSESATSMQIIKRKMLVYHGI
jgi:hypothetical protein